MYLAKIPVNIFKPQKPKREFNLTGFSSGNQSKKRLNNYNGAIIIYFFSIPIFLN